MDLTYALFAVDLINAFSPRTLFSNAELPVEQLTEDRRNNINLLLHWAESHHQPTIFLCDEHHQCDFSLSHEPPHALQGTVQTQLMHWVYQPSNSISFVKRGYDATHNPQFRQFLHNHSIPFGIVCGTSTGACVHATLTGLLTHGFPHIFLIEDACGDIISERHYSAIRTLAEIPAVTILSTQKFLDIFDSRF